jgi:NhaA family Na+:H+ antiporter
VQNESVPPSTKQYPLEPLFGRILSPFEEFLRRTTAGGIVLMTTTIVTLGVAMILGGEAIEHFWERSFSLVHGQSALGMPLREWVNDGLMALFFLLVGLELKREILVGELSSVKDAILPVAAAIGGMVVPALIYAFFNAGTPTASGWGIPMATDIAFAVGILVLLAWRVPKNLIVFLTALAIADDLGAVLVIALFYTANMNVSALSAAGLMVLVLVLFNRAGMRNVLPYVLVGVPLWYALHSSGIHATLAGIVLAATIPARPSFTPAHFQRRIDELYGAFRTEIRDPDTPDNPLDNLRMARIAKAMEKSASAVQSPLQRIEHGLAPWVTFVVIPVFALANAGIDLTHVKWQEAFASPVTVGILLGLLFGKTIGIALFSWLAVTFKLARLPSGVGWSHLAGAACLGGIGFTMSLFIAQLAFASAQVIEQAKLGILLGSALSAVAGFAWLWYASGSAPRDDDSTSTYRS